MVRKSDANMHNDKEKKCALCESLMATNSELSICSVCLGYADCCVGLEKLSDWI